VYGVFTVAVQERTREMGIRRALGAQRAGLVHLVLSGIVRVAGAGAAAGVLIAMWAGRLIEALLYGVPPTDPATFAVVLLGSLLLALAAGVLPALRASAVDPAISLATE
jgi:ABC-type antimicrobial peptide transport system permease subunit